MSNATETIKAKAVMHFINTMIGAFESGFVDSNKLTLADLHSAGFNHVKDNYGYDAERIPETFNEVVWQACSEGTK